MLSEDNIAFLEEMTTNLHNESGVDKLIILDKLRAHYYPDISFTSRDITLITHISRDRLKFIEFNAIKKIQHPIRIRLLEEYQYNQQGD